MKYFVGKLSAYVFVDNYKMFRR